MSGPRTFGRVPSIGAGVLLLVVLGLSIRHFLPSSTEIPPTAPATNRESIQSARTSAASDATGGDLPGDPPPPAIHPTSPWLAAAPNPIRVSIQPSSARSAKRRITRGGGEINLSTTEGLRVTLTVPPGSLVSSQEVTLEVVTISEAPFAAGLLAAVRLTPETLALRRAATLTFETRQPVDAAQPLAGVAVHGGEMHVMRADQSVDPKLRGRAHVELPLVRLGTYGVANTSTDELASANQHEPTDYLSRLEQRIARAFPPVAAKASAARRWSVVPAVYAQAKIFPVDDLMQSLETFFDQVVVAYFKQLPKETCHLTHTPSAANVLFSWSALANLLLPLQPLPDAPPHVREEEAKLRAQRRDRLRGFGYSDEDISFIDSMFEKYRDRIEELNAKGAALLEDAVKRQFANAYHCCLDENARSYYLERMVESMRIGALNDFAVDSEPMAKVEECNCRVSLREGGVRNVGAAVAGTITHTETFDAKKVEERATRTITNIISMSYKQTLVLVQNRGGSRYGAAYDVEGSSRTEDQLWDKYPCGPQGGYTITTGSVADDGSTTVEIRPVYNTKDKYTDSLLADNCRSDRNADLPPRRQALQPVPGDLRQDWRRPGLRTYGAGTGGD